MCFWQNSRWYVLLRDEWGGVNEDRKPRGSKVKGGYGYYIKIKYSLYSNRYHKVNRQQSWEDTSANVSSSWKANTYNEQKVLINLQRNDDPVEKWVEKQTSQQMWKDVQVQEQIGACISKWQAPKAECYACCRWRFRGKFLSGWHIRHILHVKHTLKAIGQ